MVEAEQERREMAEVAPQKLRGSRSWKICGFHLLRRSLGEGQLCFGFIKSDYNLELRRELGQRYIVDSLSI